MSDKTFLSSVFLKGDQVTSFDHFPFCIPAIKNLPRLDLHQPTVETRNRKTLRSNDLAVWELRIGSSRVYYDVVETAQLVLIRAVGVKRGNRVFIAGKELKL